MGTAQIVGGIVQLVLGLLIAVFASRLPCYTSDVGPGPGFLPLCIGIGLTICGVVTTVRAARTRSGEHAPFFLPKTRQVIFIFVTLVVTFLLMPLLGLSAGLALFTGFTMRATGRHGWFWCVVATLACAGCVRLVFGYMLDIPLPRGIIGI